MAGCLLVWLSGHSRPTLAEDAARFAEKLRRGPGAINHPVGVVPGAGTHVPPSWPLAEDGSITCLTCHSSLPRFTGGDPALRSDPERRRAIGNFCVNCHDDTATAQGTSAVHRVAIPRAHIKTPTMRLASAGEGLDGWSRQCLQCHDGVGASEAVHGTAGGRGRSFLERSHPVGIRYGDRSRRSSEPLRRRELLPRDVLIPEGKVSCISCHNIYNGKRFHLSVPLEGSRLCLTCHDMD